MSNAFILSWTATLIRVRFKNSQSNYLELPDSIFFMMTEINKKN